jgi:hypothetical protein
MRELEPKLGQWLPLNDNPIQLGVAVVDLAISHGFDIEVKIWEEDRPIFLEGDPGPELLEDLMIISDFSLQYLEELLPKGYEFIVDKEGLVLIKTFDNELDKSN